MPQAKRGVTVGLQGATPSRDSLVNDESLQEDADDY
jgi:hypothetical protein